MITREPRRKTRPPSLWRVPVLLAACTVFGLLAALLATGIWHLAAWFALTIPIGVGARYALLPAKPRRPQIPYSSS